MELYEASLKWPTKHQNVPVFRYYCQMLADIGLEEVAIRQTKEYLRENTARISQEENLKLRLQLASIYLRAELFEEAKSTYYQATQYNIEYEKGYLTSSIANNLGYTCYKMNELDSATYFFQYAWDNNPRSFDGQTGYKVSLIFNLAQVAYAQENYHLAKTKYLEGLSEFSGDSTKSRAILQGRLGIMRCQMALGEKVKFSSSLDSLESFALECDVPIREKYLPQIYDFHEKVCLSIGDNENAYKFKSQSLEIENNIKKENDQLTKYVLLELFRIASKRSEESITAKANELKTSKDRIQILKSRNTFLWLTVLSFALFGGLSLFYLIKYFRKKKQQLETEIQLKNSLESEMKMKLELKEKDVSNLALEINRKRQWIQELQSRLSELPKEARITEVKKWLNEGAYLDKKQAYFTEMVDEVNEQFFHQLKSQFPELTPKEIELCGLIKLNLSTKEIAIFKQITPESVKTARKRLRRKLGIEPGGDIYGFVQGIR